jgi:prevent-host-death family protein
MLEISVSELKRDLSGVINRAAYGKQRVIIVSRGKPKAAMISIEDLHLLESLNQEGYAGERWRAWLARADALRERTKAGQETGPIDSVEILRQLREERADDILGVR